MCFGGGKGAKDYYEEMKPEFGPLPALSLSAKKERKGQTFQDVPKRSGMRKRSLLMPMERMN